MRLLLRIAFHNELPKETNHGEDCCPEQTVYDQTKCVSVREVCMLNAQTRGQHARRKVYEKKKTEKRVGPKVSRSAPTPNAIAKHNP